MRTKSKYPKVGVTVRLREETLEKVDKIAENKREERSEILRRFIENGVRNYELEVQISIRKIQILRKEGRKFGAFRRVLAEFLRKL